MDALDALGVLTPCDGEAGPIIILEPNDLTGRPNGVRRQALERMIDLLNHLVRTAGVREPVKSSLIMQ